MPLDPAVTLALITATAASLASLAGITTMLINSWNNQRLFKNQQALAQQQRQWDIEDRAARHEETLMAVGDGTKVAKEAYTEANNVNKKIEELHKENKELHKDIGTVLEVAKAVKHATGQHKPLEKADIAAIGQEVVQAIRRTGPLASPGD